MDGAELGRRLEAARRAQGLSQGDLAERVGVNQNTIGRYEKGDRHPDPEMLRRIAEALDVSADYLLGLTDDPTVVPDQGGARPPGLRWDWVAAKLRAVRMRLGWDRAAAAAAWGVGEAELGRWEDGDPVPLDALARIAKATGRPLRWWLDGIAAGREPAGDALDRPLRDFLPVRPVPVLGRIVAGVPVEAQEDRRGEAWVTKDSTADFALEVDGDSMIGAGIAPGDLVLVRRVEQWDGVPEGSLVVALVDGETTLKYLVRDGETWLLRAANPAYPDREMVPGRDRVQGIVVGVQGQPRTWDAWRAAGAGDAWVDARGLTADQRSAVAALVEQFRRANQRAAAAGEAER